jgi:hypothetical protein
MTENKTHARYEVLSPWAEADPIPGRGLTATRLTDLAEKRIGLLCNTKRAAKPISAAVEKLLKERFPSAELSRYTTMYAVGPPEVETEGKARFEAWLKGVDAVVAAVGD